MRKLRMLAACEMSGRVRDAFVARGWDAWSCDFLPSETPGQHVQGDVLPLLQQEWDLIIAHPPCTYLCVSGMHWTKRGLRPQSLTDDALRFVRAILEAPCPYIALENPVGVISSEIRKPDQIIQPYQFGHDASKKTCLWLKGLPPLKPTQIVPPHLACKVCKRISEVGCGGCPCDQSDEGSMRPVWARIRHPAVRTNSDRVSAGRLSGA